MLQQKDYSLSMPDAPSLLRAELLLRLKKNPSFSLRAFALNLKISPGYLSQVLNGQKQLTEEKAYSLVSHLPWSEEKKRLFINLVRWQRSKDLKFKEHLLAEIQKESDSSAIFFDLQIDEFKLISQWHHAAIVELTSIKSFSLTAQNVSQRLGLSTAEAQEAIQRLLRLGILEERQGHLKKTKVNYQIKDIPSEAIRSYHSQNLSKAQEALHSQPLEKREFYSTTMAINPAKIKKAKALIHKFSTEIMECLEEGPREHLYQFNVQLFQLDCSVRNKNPNLKKEKA
ncbi:MAG TPA: DUF4423 domain-containing protein [Pseudobdellovibrionaceae bacterium]|jgi:uncharacterized protein (TIGR02147 family)